MENHSHQIISETGDLLVDAEELNQAEHLLSRIADVAQKAEDLIEVEAADRVRDGSMEVISSSFLLDLQQKMEEMDGIINEDIVIKAKERKHPHLPPTSSMAPPPPSSERAKTTSSSSSSMLGFDGYLNRLLDELNGDHTGLQILPIVRMGGVGKTTLARNVYENPLMVESFAVRVWVTVSQTFRASDVFEQALSCVQKSSSDSTGDDGKDEEMRRTLFGRRYLIVLDDMWSVDAWEKVKFYFPDTNNRSRIVVTTREQRLVDYFASSSAVAVDFLGEENSWKLFCDKTLSQEACSPEFEEAGKRIARKCKGLPLAISVLGGLLRNSPRTQEYWEGIAQDKSWILEHSGEGNKLLSLIYMSYKHLPVCFKPCFLYLGLFPEDHPIHVSQLIQFWVAEGFVKPKPDQTLEEVAESYIKELVDRNLMMVGALRLNKKFETCFLHDLVRELCIRIAEKEKFYFIQRDLAGKQQFIMDRRSASSYPPDDYYSLKHLSIYYPLVFQGQIAVPMKSRLLRVYVSSTKLTSQEVNLRLLAHDKRRSRSSRTMYPANFPSSTSLFWSLQTLILPRSSYPVRMSHIWKMPQLRHIEISPLILPKPPTGNEGDSDTIVLRNLQMLKRVWNLELSEEVCKRMPNIKELEITHISQGDGWNVGFLNKPESLWGSFEKSVSLKNMTLPDSLKELSLKGCRLPWSYMAIIGRSLPHLQIMHLLRNSVVGEEWNLEEEEEEIFPRLKYLRIEYCDDLIRWDAEASNLSELEEIPLGIGDIPTLELMDIRYCGESAAMSAIKILEEQQSNENLGLQLQLQVMDLSEAEMLKEKVQELGITSQNLHISSLLT